MKKFKVLVDDKGNFYTKGSFKLVAPDFVGVKDGKAKITIKLLKPSGIHIKVLTLTCNGKTYNIAVESGKAVLTLQPYPLKVGDNAISFEGTSDKPGEDLEIEVTPQLLK
jgi:hypothetical protein